MNNESCQKSGQQAKPKESAPKAAETNQNQE
jgi:hypothetical protein